jgi:hypothetical protein
MLMDKIRIWRLAALTTFVAAIAASLVVGTAVAAPIKNAQRTCGKAGGTFDPGDSAYTCTGIDPTGADLNSALRQCVHSYKGEFSVLPADPATGALGYVCNLP